MVRRDGSGVPRQQDTRATVFAPAEGERIVSARPDAELARLRAIEAAANDIIDRSPLDVDGETTDEWCHYCEAMPHQAWRPKRIVIEHADHCEWRALRAALQETRDDGRA